MGQKHSLHSSGPRKPSHKERRCQTWEPNLTGVNRGIELNRTAHPNMETKTQKKWYHLTPVPPASNGVKGAVTREQVAKTSGCSLTKHRLDRYANPKLHHCKKPQTPNWKPAQSTKKTRPWKQTGRRALNRTPSSKIVSAPGDKVRAQNAPTCRQKSQLN